MFRFLVSCLVVLALGPKAAAQEGGGPALIILDVTEGGEAITFDGPLQSEDPVLSGQSIAQLIAGPALFPPIEGLPDEVWKEKPCSGCHQWDRESLCAQGQTYLSAAGEQNMAKAHPMGGPLKRVLRAWSAQGCN